MESTFPIPGDCDNKQIFAAAIFELNFLYNSAGIKPAAILLTQHPEPLKEKRLN